MELGGIPSESVWRARPRTLLSDICSSTKEEVRDVLFQLRSYQRPVLRLSVSSDMKVKEKKTGIVQAQEELLKR